MKNYTITVNGNVYDVTVEEGTGSAAPAAAPKAAPKAAPAAPKAAASASQGAGSVRIEAGAAGKVFKIEANVGAAVKAGDLTAGFEAAHALKGVLANLALTPVLKPVSELTEHLRARTEMDYTPLLAEAEQEMSKLLEIINE